MDSEKSLTKDVCWTLRVARKVHGGRDFWVFTCPDAIGQELVDAGLLIVRTIEGDEFAT